MAIDNTAHASIELFDVAKSKIVWKLPLALIRFIPRKGERILISVTGLNDWKDPNAATPETPSQGGKITLYVEPSEK